MVRRDLRQVLDEMPMRIESFMGSGKHTCS
jgi:hypothetical protein